MAPRHDAQAAPDLVLEEGAFVVHRIGPETYSVALEIEGKPVMVAADYFTGPEAVETAILWLKRHATSAKVIWRD